MRLPFIIRSRAFQEWLDRGHATDLEHLRQRIEDWKAFDVKASSRLADTQLELKEERAKNTALRKEFAGDLQLERSRYDEFVRDMMEKVLGSPATAARRPSSEQEPPLPGQVQSAIEDVSFGNSSLEAHLEKEARRRLDAAEKPEKVAELIRAGERPE